jgi:hypothetical protein
MDNKPNSNLDGQKKETPSSPPGSTIGGDHIIIQGSVGAGANVGSGRVTADYISQGDMTIHPAGAKANTPEQFVEMLGDLRTLLEQAKEKGELDPLLAGQAIKNLDAVAEQVAKEPKPAKPDLIKRLEAVAQVIDAAVDMLTQDGSVGSILLKALPVAVMLVRLASHLF